MPQTVPVDLIAIVATVTMSTMSIWNRQGLRTGSPFMAAVVINATIMVFYFLFSTAAGVRWTALPRAGVLWFLVAGVASPALSMTMFYISLNWYGVGRSVPVAMGSNPLFSVVLSILLLGERPHWTLYIGTTMIMGGIWVVSRPKDETGLRWRQTLLPLTAGFFWGLAAVLRKLGLTVMPVPHVAATIQSFAALIFLFSVIWVFPPGQRLVRSWRAFKYFLGAGLSFTVAMYCLLIALSYGQVSRVMAILGSTPLLTVILAALFLGDLEKITRRIYAGAGSIVAGIVLITLFRG